METDDTHPTYTNYDELYEIYDEARAIYEASTQIDREEWYSVRFRIIQKYAKIDWGEIYSKFERNDAYICNTVIKINELINSLIEEYSCRPTFNFINYYSLLHNVKSLWEYYEQNYIGEESDGTVVDLIAAMAFL